MASGQEPLTAGISRISRRIPPVPPDTGNTFASISRQKLWYLAAAWASSSDSCQGTRAYPPTVRRPKDGSAQIDFHAVTFEVSNAHQITETPACRLDWHRPSLPFGTAHRIATR